MATTAAERTFWWNEGAKNVHQAVSATVKSIVENQKYREKDFLTFMRLYGGLEYIGLDIGTYSRTGAPQGKIALNVVKSCCDTATAKQGKNRPKPKPLTNDGDWKLGKKAKKLDKFGQGAFAQVELYRLAPRIFLDATVFGTGIVKIFSVDGRFQADRVLPHELLIDDADGMHGKPRSAYQRKLYAREVALAVFGTTEAKRQAIKDAAAATADSNLITAASTSTDQIWIFEAWHLPSKRGAKDGRHVICTETATLRDEDWTRERFPFAVLRWGDNLLGWYGVGIAQELQDIQYEINFLLQRIQEAFKLLGAPMVFVEALSDVDPQQFSNVVGNVYVYTGTPPTVAAFQTIHPEVFAHLDRLYQRAYEIIGISQLSAMSKKPAGLDSAPAQREYNEIESERFQIVGQDYEQWFIDVFRLLIDEAREIFAKNGAKRGAFQIRVTGRKHGRRFLETIDWADCDMDEDVYDLQVFPESSLPSTPAGRRQELGERMKLQIITPEEMLEQMDLPDTERQNNLGLAALYDINETIERILEADFAEDMSDAEREALAESVYQPPEAFQNLKLGLKRFGVEYLNAKRSGAPEENLELMRRWMSEAEAQMAAAQPPQAAPASAPPAPAPAPDMPPPGAMPMAA